MPDGEPAPTSCDFVAVPPAMANQSPGPLRISREAEVRAYALLEQTLGVSAAARVFHGGGYPVPSRRHADIEYLVPMHGPTTILWKGVPVGQFCLQVIETMPWADRVLQIVKALEADETVVYATGNWVGLTTGQMVRFSQEVQPPWERTWCKWVIILAGGVATVMLRWWFFS